MNPNALLTGHNIDPKDVLVMRHRPHEPELRKALPWRAVEQPSIFNAYQFPTSSPTSSLRSGHLAASRRMGPTCNTTFKSARPRSTG